MFPEHIQLFLFFPVIIDSFYLPGITAEEFIQVGPDGKSKYEQFKALVKELTGAREVEIFSVITPDRVKPHITDIRYAAHGSPYYSPVLLDGLLELHRDELESRIDVTIDMVPISFCTDDVCEEVFLNKIIFLVY